MNEVVENIKQELLKRCNNYKEKYGYDFWNNHIKYVVKNSIELAKKYNADVEIVELGALLHDISMPSEIGPRDEHHNKLSDRTKEGLKDRYENIMKVLFS